MSTTYQSKLAGGIRSGEQFLTPDGAVYQARLDASFRSGDQVLILANRVHRRNRLDAECSTLRFDSRQIVQGVTR